MKVNQAYPSFNAALGSETEKGANGRFIAPLKRTHFSPVKHLMLID